MQNTKLFIGGTLVFVIGFLIGKINFSVEDPVIIKKEITPEISLVILEKILGDKLFVEISGPVRVIWNGDKLVENDGNFQIPLGQIPRENDLKYEEFPYTANTKTGKFYNSNSYNARGVELKHRRFFNTITEATSAGFVASKNLK